MKPLRTCSKPSPLRARPRRVRRLSRLATLGAVLLVLGFLAVRYRMVWIVGDSMRPTYRPGDLVVVDRWAYRSQSPRRWDVVVASHHGDWMVKRVVGLPGDQVAVRHGHVQLNGARVLEPQAIEPGILAIESGQLLGDRYALLGDNRGIPEDSLVHAVVHRSQLVGGVVSTWRPIQGLRALLAGLVGWFSPS